MRETGARDFARRRFRSPENQVCVNALHVAPPSGPTLSAPGCPREVVRGARPLAVAKLAQWRPAVSPYDGAHDNITLCSAGVPHYAYSRPEVELGLCVRRACVHVRYAI